MSPGFIFGFMTPRVLTYDEKKAAEAAFRGLPPNPGWSSAARTVYDGLIEAIPDASAPLLHDLARAEAEKEPEVQDDPAQNASIDGAYEEAKGATFSRGQDPLNYGTQVTSREEAVQAGLLIDVTPQALDVGLSLPVGLTRALWRFSISESDAEPTEELDLRIRDLLKALRLHLSRSSVILPVSQFPALLSDSSNSAPKVYAVVAIIHSEAPDQHSLTLSLPNELTT